MISVARMERFAEGKGADQGENTYFCTNAIRYCVRQRILS
jgi:hypothetical protein